MSNVEEAFVSSLEQLFPCGQIKVATQRHKYFLFAAVEIVCSSLHQNCSSGITKIDELLGNREPSAELLERIEHLEIGAPLTLSGCFRGVATHVEISICASTAGPSAIAPEPVSSL